MWTRKSDFERSESRRNEWKMSCGRLSLATIINDQVDVSFYYSTCAKLNGFLKERHSRIERFTYTRPCAVSDICSPIRKYAKGKTS